jgi:hypothetical protein
MKYRRFASVCLTAVLIALAGAFARDPAVTASESSPAVLLEGTVVTMDGSRQVIRDGRVLVRNGRIAALWKGAHPPKGIDLIGAVRAPLGHTPTSTPD